MPLTPHQQRALATDRHLAVTANAGSGKTRVLVERYLRLVGAGTPLEEIVAITFTDKAAGELKRKIAERVAEARIGAATPAEAVLWEGVRDRLSTAFIGTIHSFCSRILREFPVEAGIDASFTMLESVDTASAIQDAIVGTLREALRPEASPAETNDLFALMRGMGRKQILDTLVTLVSKRELFERLEGEKGVYHRSDDEIIAFWRETLAAAAKEELNSPLLQRDLTAIVQASQGKGKGEAEKELRAMTGGGTLEARAAACARLLGLLFTITLSLRASTYGRGRDGDEVHEEVERIAGRYDALKLLVGFSAGGFPEEAHRTLLRAGRTFLSLARTAADRYEHEKAGNGRMDFDDLQLAMRRLLRNDAIRDQLSRRFLYVMVDEYQDTSTLQFDILLPLLDRLAAGNLFIVGDPKQSIYRFRDADVRVFERTQSAIAEAAGKGAIVPLGESFRPLPHIAATVNRLFSRLMPAYDPLVVARANNDPGRVELLLAGGKADDPEHGEPELIARRILGLIREGQVVYDGEERPRPMSFRDVALLLRKRNQLQSFEQAFIRNGVPYQVSGGIGFYQTQDVLDLMNYLSFLLSPGDDVALAGILRSPFFAVSDVELFQLVQGRQEGSLWDILSTGRGAGGTIQSLSHATAVLTEDLIVGPRIPVPELLARIMQRTRIAGGLAGTIRGEQALANLDKLRVMARTFEAQGFMNLFDFVARLRRLMEEEEKEGQAAIESQTDAVQVMTVHAAKGLEFPVVVVPRLHAPAPRIRAPFIDDELGIGFRPEESEEAMPPIAAFMRERETGRQRDEEQRIFYVACTRARDVLILSAEEKAQRGEGDWLRWWRGAFPDSAAGEMWTDESLSFFRAHNGSGERIVLPHRLTIHVIRSIDALPPPPAAVPLRAALPNLLIDPLHSESTGEIFSASKIRTYCECPSKYYHQYVLGYPLGAGPFAEGEDDERKDVEYPAELRGRVFHAVMEQVDRLVGGEASVDAAVRAAMAHELLPRADSAERLAADVASLVKNVLASPVWKEIARGTDVKTEYSISATLGIDYVTGTLDRLFRDADGLWTVLDYKTDALTPATVNARAEVYWPQLRFYAVMVGRLHRPPSIKMRILFASLPDLPLVKEISAAELLNAEAEIGIVIGRIKAGEFAPPQQPCRDCPFLPNGCKK